MTREEARFYLVSLKTELHRLELPVSCSCTEEIREEYRGKVMEALDVASSALYDPDGLEELRDMDFTILRLCADGWKRERKANKLRIVCIIVSVLVSLLTSLALNLIPYT